MRIIVEEWIEGEIMKYRGWDIWRVAVGKEFKITGSRRLTTAFDYDGPFLI